MPHVYLTGSTSSSQSVLNDNRLTSSPDPLISVQNELDAFGQGNFVLVAPFTDDEDENNPPNYFSGVSNPEPLSPILDEEVITRTGEASRLRRRGALHGRRRQLTYVTLSCGVELPWRFKFEGYSDEKNLGKWNSQTLLAATPLLQPRNGSIRSGKLPLEYPSTGCRAILTSCASISSYQNVYSAPEPVDSVRAVDEIYVDEEQKEIVKEVLADVCHSTEWKPVACCQCGNVVGFRYSQTLADQQGHHSEDPYGRVTINRFAFFPSTVTSSKPYNFAEGKFYSESSSERPPQFQPIPTSGVDPTVRTRSPRSVDSLRFEPLNRDILPPQDGSAPIHVRLPSTSRSQSSTHLSNTRPMSSENLLPSIPEGPSATESTHQENVDIIWGRWLPNPYVYSSDTENGEAIERELERRRLGLSEAISILQTTHQEFMTGHQDSYDGLEEPESHPRVDDVIPLRNEGISEDINQPSTSITSDEPTQTSNPYPYTHLSSSAPVPLSISTRARDAGRPEQHTSNGNHSPSSTPYLMSEPLTTTNNDFSLSTSLSAISANARPSDQTLPLPTHLPISYDSPAAISDIEASNGDTGAVENIGIMVEVAPPPQNFTSNLGSAAVVASLISQSNDASRSTQRNAVESTLPITSPNHSSLEEQETNDSTIINFGFDTSAQLYPTMNQQYPGFEPKIENLFNMEVMAGQLPNAVGEVGSFGPQLTSFVLFHRLILLTPWLTCISDSNVFREYTPSLSPLSPGALATPSLPYSPTSSVPLPPTLLPLIEILDSIEMEVLPLARHSDLEDSDTSSQTSNTDSNAESQNNIRDESVYTTELPWDCYDPDPSWLDYEGPLLEESPIAWLTEPIDSALPFSANVFENPEASE